MSRHPDDPVPPDDQLACLMWKCYEHGVRRVAEGRYETEFTWWQLQPTERAVWQYAAQALRESLNGYIAVGGRVE